MTEKSEVMIWKAIVSSIYLDIRDLHELDAVLLLGGERIHAVARHPGVNLKRKGF